MASLKKNFAYNMFYQILTIALPLITAPYVSRILGAEGVGVYSYTYSVANYFMFFAMLGISNHGNRSIASAVKSKHELSKCFINNYCIQLCSGIIAALSYIFYITVFPVENRSCAIIQGLVVVSGILDINWFFWGLEEFKLTVVRNTVCKLASLICIFLFVRSRDDLWIYVLIMSSTALLSQLLLWRFLVKRIELQKPSCQEIKVNIRPVIILFLPILAYSLYRVTDKIMIGAFSTMIEVGYYDNAEKILNIPIGIITALGNVMLPRISNLLSEGNIKAQTRYIKLSFLFVSLVEGSLCFGIAAVSDVFVPLYYGDEFVQTSWILEILIFTALISGWANVIRTQYLIPTRKDNIYVISMLVAAAINFVLNWIFIPEYGAMGALIGTVSAELIILFIQMISVRNEFKWHSLISENIFYIISGVIMCGVVRFIGNIVNVGSLLKLVIEVVVGVVVYFLLAFTVCNVRKDDLYFLIKSFFNKVKNKMA